MYNISILSIGDELCIGQTVNTNASWISQKLLTTGAFIKSHSTIRDSKDEIVSEIKRLSIDNDLIIITGGLGPTHDDITKKVLCDYFEDKLEMNNDVLQDLKALYKKRGREFKEMHSYQAMLPRNAKIFPNKVGTAQGMMFETETTAVLAMPGVPREMQYIVEHSLIDFVNQKIDLLKSDKQVYRTIRTAGIPESDLAGLIGNLDFLGLGSLAFLPSYRGVRLRIGLSGNDSNSINKELDRIEDYLDSKIGKFISSKGEEDLSETVGKLLIKHKKTVSVAESCTGGLLGGSLTEMSGSSAYFLGGILTYSNEAKEQRLNLPRNILEKYGAVSEETATIMARSVREKFGSSYGISITGIAGPNGGSKEKPVGTVWIGLSKAEKTVAKKYIFGNDRVINREISVGFALTMLLNDLKEKE